ncbi:MAG: hypothetical protein H6638_05665 [Ardenticatenales bacterium]|nr:hypothetical protein [Ardenticatenales bacterium]
MTDAAHIKQEVVAQLRRPLSKEAYVPSAESGSPIPLPKMRGTSPG